MSTEQALTCEIDECTASFIVLSRQNRSGRTDFGRNFCKHWSPVAAKICLAGPVLAIGPLCQFWCPVKCKFVTI